MDRPALVGSKVPAPDSTSPLAADVRWRRNAELADGDRTDIAIRRPDRSASVVYRASLQGDGVAGVRRPLSAGGLAHRLEDRLARRGARRGERRRAPDRIAGEVEAPTIERERAPTYEEQRRADRLPSADQPIGP
eukprot:11230926-Alexandrium_andersonii.AAC.1